MMPNATQPEGAEEWWTEEEWDDGENSEEAEYPHGHARHSKHHNRRNECTAHLRYDRIAGFL